MASGVPPLAKLLFLGAAVLALTGLVAWALAGSRFPLGRLPGDVRIERPGFRFYFPIATSLLVSAVLTAVLWLVAWWRGRGR
jgi:hypothetical protein